MTAKKMTGIILRLITLLLFIIFYNKINIVKGCDIPLNQNDSLLPYIFTMKWGENGGQEGEFSGPSNIVIDSENHIYIVDYCNHRIQKFDSSGRFITQWGSKADEPGQFAAIYGITIDSKDNIYISDYINRNIQKFDSNGKFITTWNSYWDNGEQTIAPSEIAVDSEGNILVMSPGYRIWKYTSNGKFIDIWDLPVIYQRKGHELLWDIEVDSSGNIYLVHGYHSYFDDNSVTECCIQKFDKSRNFIKQWGYEGVVNGHFKGGVKLGIDDKDNIYAIVLDKNCIQKFNSEGSFITQWGEGGTSDGQFNIPIGIDIDSEGNIYVVDASNCRIQKFAPNPEYKESN